MKDYWMLAGYAIIAFCAIIGGCVVSLGAFAMFSVAKERYKNGQLATAAGLAMLGAIIEIALVVGAYFTICPTISRIFG